MHAGVSWANASKRRSQQGAQVIHPPVRSLPLDVGGEQLVAQPWLALDSVL